MDHVAIYRLSLKYEGLLRFYDSHKSLASRGAIRLIIAVTSGCRAIAILLTQIVPKDGAALRRVYPIVSQLGSGVRWSEAFRAWIRITYDAFRIRKERSTSGSPVGCQTQ
jgi:hypothetical protein